MENLPFYVPLVFVLTTGLTVWCLFKAAHRSKVVLLFCVALLAVQAMVATTGFFTNTHTLPPRFLFLVGPPMVLIVGLFSTKQGRAFLDRLDLGALTLLHAIRVLVEFVLFWLFLNKAVPELMTFEGRNFDILSGISAPFIYYFGFVKKKLNPKIILLWNLVCLGLLFNIVFYAIFSVPYPFQKFAFSQPNIGVLYFPFIWLPGFIVPVVLLSHLVAIRQLIRVSRKENFLPNGFVNEVR